MLHRTLFFPALPRESLDYESNRQTPQARMTQRNSPRNTESATANEFASEPENARVVFASGSWSNTVAGANVQAAELGSTNFS
jgi:hypothetical protein